MFRVVGLSCCCVVLLLSFVVVVVVEAQPKGETLSNDCLNHVAFSPMIG